MGINVKNAEVEAEVRLLAAELDVGLTEAILDAVRWRRGMLTAERVVAREAEIARKMAVIRVIQDEIRPFLKPGVTSSCDEFYGEDGLPA